VVGSFPASPLPYTFHGLESLTHFKSLVTGDLGGAALKKQVHTADQVKEHVRTTRLTGNDGLLNIVEIEFAVPVAWNECIYGSIDRELSNRDDSESREEYKGG
jgi:hypothetical protein